MSLLKTLENNQIAMGSCDSVKKFSFEYRNDSISDSHLADDKLIEEDRTHTHQNSLLH
jgi:hypothetical protein